MNAGSETITGTTNLLSRNIAFWDSLASTYGNNISAMIFGSLPPYLDTNGADATYPLQDSLLQSKLNVAALIIAREKAAGRPVWFVNFYPPNVSLTVFTTADQLRNWFNNSFIPEKVIEAKFAEALMVEAYSPVYIEWETMLMAQTSLFGVSGSLSASEQVALSQELVDSIANAVRPHYTGKLIVGSYLNYALHGTHWNAMDYSKFDIAAFTLVPRCNVPTGTMPLATQLGDYFDSQITNLQTVVTNSNGMPWMVFEFFAAPGGFFDCGYYSEDAFKTIEDSIYQIGFSKIDGVTPAPVGITLDKEKIYSPEALSRALDYLSSH